MKKIREVVYVKLFLELYELDGQFKPTRFSMGERTYAQHFPLLASDYTKHQYLKELIRGRFELHGALYFKIDVIEERTDKIIFRSEDFLEDDPAKRYCQIWKWDKINHRGMGFTYYPEQAN